MRRHQCALRKSAEGWRCALGWVWGEDWIWGEGWGLGEGLGEGLGSRGKARPPAPRPTAHLPPNSIPTPCSLGFGPVLGHLGSAFHDAAVRHVHNLPRLQPRGPVVDGLPGRHWRVGGGQGCGSGGCGEQLESGPWRVRTHHSAAPPPLCRPTPPNPGTTWPHPASRSWAPCPRTTSSARGGRTPARRGATWGRWRCASRAPRRSLPTSGTSGEQEKEGQAVRWCMGRPGG